MELIIRKEVKADYRVVEEIVKAAFAKAEHSDGDEHNLVARLRVSDAFVPALSLVAEVGGAIVGYILFTEAKVAGVTVLVLAPVAVKPGMQKMGIGEQLIHTGHQIAKAMGYGFSVVLGHAAYYPRFGYIPAARFGIQPPFEVPDENFMAYHLQGSQERLEGTIVYAREFFEA